MESRWFSIIILGEKRRIGVLRKQDEVMKIYQLLLIGYIAEKEWVHSDSE